METWNFSGLGTQWSVSVDSKALSDAVRGNILAFVGQFERRFSRFLETSEVNAFRHASSGTYTISPEFVELLDRAIVLRDLTGGVYDPAVGALIEGAGYDAQYRFASEDMSDFQLPHWSLEGNRLTLDGPVVFDFGGIGKGYCIDRVSDILERHGYQYRIVEGGGDMVATEKKNGDGFRVALEWPGKPDTAAGIAVLKHQGLAASDSFRRRWGHWHHIIDPITKEPVSRVVGCVAVADCAWSADCMTSGLFLSHPDRYTALGAHFHASYLVFFEDEAVHVSRNWKGELF